MGSTEKRFTPAQPTEEITGIVYDVVMGWYPTGRIDWEDVWDRVDGAELADGSILDLGNSLVAPELIELRKAVLAMRREAQ